MTSRATQMLIAGMALAVTAESVSFTPFPSAQAASVSPRLALEPCHVGSLAEEIRCGVHEAFENRAQGTGKRLRIHVAVLPATGRDGRSDPLFMMAGGPGQGARGLAAVAARIFREIRRTRDIVLVDLRGTGASAPLACQDTGDELSGISDGDLANLARGCAASLDADPPFYTHRESLADLDEIREGLGYARINLWGGSWGTRASLLYALRYPRHTRSIVLDGAVALTMDFPTTASTDAQAALDRVMSDCAADRDCAAAFPDPRADLDRLLKRFDRGPIAVAIRHPRTSEAATVTLSRGLAMDILRGALYSPRDAATVMLLVKHAGAGDLAPLVAQHLRTSSWSIDDMALGATMSILCSEDLPRVSSRDFTASASSSLFGSTYAEAWRSRCSGWKEGATFDEPSSATSDVPALILSGGHDPVTPPRAGELMARHFSNQRHIVVDNAAHNASFSGCVPRLIAEFLERGTAAALDDRCVNDLAWPPFVVGIAGTQP